MSKIIGIDLGTGMSAVSVVEGGEPKIIVNSEGHRTTPSVVCFAQDGERKVGENAKRQALMNPETTIYSVKRFIGRSYDEIESFTDKYTYKVKKGKNGLATVEINDKEYMPQEISAAVLQKMKKTAEDFLGEEVKDAVITVPAYFNDAQRKATKEAGEIAGLNVVRIINEPTAAALAFGLDKSDKDMKILVLDSGCGTTDLSILELGSGVFEVLGTNGDTFLGGDDVDNVIVEWMTEEGYNQFGTDLSKDPMALQRLKEAAEKAKIELSSSNSTDINLPYITVVDNVPRHLNLTLTRAQFERKIYDIILKCKNLCLDLLKQTDLRTDDIDEILLVGGTTRIPALQQMVKDVFGKEGNKSVNPDEAVSLGAAIQGSILSGEQKGILLLDVTPLNLNITTMGDVATTMIEANTTIPTTKTEIFSTAVDNQSAVDIEITQGNRGMAKDNKYLGKFILDGIMPARRGVPQIEVKFALDSNGILEVTATDKATGKSQNIHIEGSSGLDKAEVERMKAEAESHTNEDKKAMERVQTINMAETALYQTEKNIDELKDKLTEEQISSLNTSAENLKTVLNVPDADRDIDSITAASKNLTETWYKISESLNKNTQDSSMNPFGNSNPFENMSNFTGNQ